MVDVVMKKTVRLFILLITGSHLLLAEEVYIPGQKSDKDFASYGEAFIYNNCVDCHDDDEPKGDLNLMALGPVDESNMAVWKSIWAQVALGEMPPKKKDKLSSLEKLEFTDWLVQQMSEAMKSKGGFHVHKTAKKGNFVPHNLLFLVCQG